MSSKRLGSGGASAAARSFTGSIPASRPARLRIECMSNTEAATLSWFVHITTFLLVVGVVVLVLLKFNIKESDVLFQDKAWYAANLGFACTALTVLLGLGAWFGAAAYATRVARRSWGFRRRSLCRAASVLLATELLSTTFWMATYAVAVGYDCSWFDNSISYMSTVRWTAYNCSFTWMVMMAHACCRYRGPDLPADPDQQLVMDVASARKVLLHVPVLVLWAFFEAAVVVTTVIRVHDPNNSLARSSDNCFEQSYDCRQGNWFYVALLAQLVGAASYTMLFLFYLRRAYRDHSKLPWARYRLSNLYIRLLGRHGTVAFGVVLVSVVVIASVNFTSCWSYLDVSLGIAPVQLSLVLLASVQLIALRPKLEQPRDVLVTWRQHFCWTLDSLPAALAERDAELLQAQSSHEGAFQALLGQLSGGRRWLAAAAERAVAELEGAHEGLTGVFEDTKQCASLDAEQEEQARQAQQQLAQQAQQAQQQLAQQAQQHPGGAGVGSLPGSPQASKPAGAMGTLGGAPPGSSPRSPLAPGSPHSLRAPSSPRLHLSPADAAALHARLERLSLSRLTSMRLSIRREHTPAMFCFELAVRSFAWSKYAYRHWPDSAGGMSQDDVQALFGVSNFAALRTPQTDSRAIMGWRDGFVVCAFRGTSSLANVLSDVKAWQTPVLPKRYHGSRLLKVHAGFYHAFNAHGFRQQLLQQVEDAVAGFNADTSLRIHLTGHSLGGALAVIAAHELTGLYPEAEITVYTFGAPRVGNRAFSARFKLECPNSWALVNQQDPVPRVPGTVRFRHACGPVRIGWRGDIIVRPSFFERSVIARSGGVPGHHMMGRYALSLAAVIKAQFSSSKWLPGGKAGATELAQALDLGQALMLLNMDLASLQDPAVLPRSSEARAPRKRKVPLAASERWWLRPAAPLLAWCGSADAEAAAGKGADVEAGITGSGEHEFDGHWSGEVDGAAGEEAAAAQAEGEAASAGPDMCLPSDLELQSVDYQQQQTGLQDVAQEAAALAREAAAVGVGGAVAAIGGARAVTTEVVSAAVDAAGAAADYSRQQWELRSDAARQPAPPEDAG